MGVKSMLNSITNVTESLVVRTGKVIDNTLLMAEDLSEVGVAYTTEARLAAQLETRASIKKLSDELSIAI